jgi:hypothetical protein
MAQLPREIAPGKDPWNAIRERIDRQHLQPLPGKLRMWALPAAVAATAVFAVVLILQLQQPNAGSTPTQLALDSSSAESASYAPHLTLAASEAEYRAAFREFIAVGQARPSLAPQTIETIERGWAELREAEKALEAALAANPEDRFLNDRMLELRARQLGFLQQLASLDQKSRRLMT